MKKVRFSAVSLILMVIILVSTMMIFNARALNSWQGYVKPSFPDYAPSGMPDFDERQDAWGPGPGTYTWCGPVAVANSLWWLDSEYESILNQDPVAPPTISDHFNLVPAYGPWDDHDPKNVDPLVHNLAAIMDTDGQTSHDGHLGTRWNDLERGIQVYIGSMGLSGVFEVHNRTFPDFGWIDTDVQKCQDVELFLEFYQLVGGIWTNSSIGNPSLEAGHFVTCAGSNSSATELLISDPLQDAFEAGTAPRGGREPVAHAFPHAASVHNDTQYVSQDAYTITQWLGPPLGPYGPQPVSELVGYMQTLGYPPTWHAFIRAAIATSPKTIVQWNGYAKPDFVDYAPSGMPDFDERQDNWGPAQGTYTWCGPVAAANSLWWLDSEYESTFNPDPIAPPTVSDHFSLVTSYSQWDDHDPQNVDPLVQNLAFLMDTDGRRTGDGHIGTRWWDLESGIQMYLAQQGMVGFFEVHNSSFPTFTWIGSETEKCQDVELFLEFYQLTGGGWQNQTITNPSLEFGHFVTCAGVNSSASELLISDPLQDAFEAGAAPRGGRSVPHAYPHGSSIHNDTIYVSQDAYQVAQWVGPPGPYGPGQNVWELVGYLETLGYDPTFHAFIRAAVATSPSGVHDVAVTNITSAKTIIGQGYGGNVTPAAQNQGDFTENFNVTTYANTTQTVSLNFVLVNGTTQPKTFVWNTTGFGYGNYTLVGAADIVLGELDTGDNNCTCSVPVHVGVPGDVSSAIQGVYDKKCDMRDVAYLIILFNTKPSSLNWNPNADVDNDGVVNMRDIAIAILNYNKHE